MGILEVDFNLVIAIVGAIGSHWVHRMGEDSQEEEGGSVEGNEGERPSANFMLFLFFEFWFYLVIIVILAGFGL